jgi:hypothetical protein
MSHTMEHSPTRFPLTGRVRKSFDDALYRAVLIEIGATYTLVEWVNAVDDGLDEIHELRHRKLPGQTLGEGSLMYPMPESQSPDTAPALTQDQIGSDLQDYARVAWKTFSSCYQSYVELSEILDPDRNPHDPKIKPAPGSPRA